MCNRKKVGPRMEPWGTSARVAPNLLKALAILSDTTIRIVDWEDLVPYWKSEKGPQFSRWSANLLLTSFSITLLITEKRLTGQWFLAVDLFSTFLITWTTNENFH